MLCDVKVERRTPPEEDPPADTGGFESPLAGDIEGSAIVAMMELDRAKPQEGHDLLVSESSNEHDGQRMVCLQERNLMLQQNL
jgi:hypothetical protein